LHNNFLKKYSLKNKIVIITGGCGMLGIQHAEAIAEVEGTPILFDKVENKSEVERIKKEYNSDCFFIKGDVTKESDIRKLIENIKVSHKKIDILINNAALNPDPALDNAGSKNSLKRFEDFTLNEWDEEINVGLKGSFLCSKLIGNEMSKSGGGVIINISSDLGLIAPDQRLYKIKGNSEDQQPVKPVTYPVIKHGIIGLTKYLATYWLGKNVRANALCAGGVYNNQPMEFVNKIEAQIPLGRMAEKNEYKSSIQYLSSDASKYMNGACLVIDGGRTCW